MYKCRKCGHIFEDGEETYWTEEHGEKFSGCPMCLGDFDVVKPCSKCGEFLPQSKLYEGMCRDCLSDLITYKNTFEYLCETEDELAYFVFKNVFECDPPEKVNGELLETVSRVFKRKQLEDVLNSEDTFLKKCREYIIEYDSLCGISHFVSWLRKRGEV